MLRLLDFRPRPWPLSTCLLVLGMLTPVISSAQVYRCIVHGQVVYQQSPCESSGGQGREIHIAPPPESSGHGPVPEPPPPRSEAVTPPTASEPPPPPDPPRLDPKSQRCANWYLQRLGLGLGFPFSNAYVRPESLEKGVLTLTIVVPGPNGWFSKKAACEFRGEVLDEGWTEEHAKRLDWAGLLRQ
jgi:hypothetical protein